MPHMTIIGQKYCETERNRYGSYCSKVVWFGETFVCLAPLFCMTFRFCYFGKDSPNIGFPLLDCPSVTSS